MVDKISLGELDLLFELLYKLMSAFESFYGLLTNSLNDYIAMTGIPITIPDFFGGDVSPMFLMLAVGLSSYVAYQFITWVLNIVT